MVQSIILKQNSFIKIDEESFNLNVILDYFLTQHGKLKYMNFVGTTTFLLNIHLQ